jgi:acyl-coenzyme A thioesterase 13
MNRVVAYMANCLTKNPGKTFFDRTMIESMKVSHCELNGKTFIVKLQMPVLPEWTNSGGTLHGGAISTIIDQATTIAIAGIDDRYTVSVDLSVSFVGAVKDGPLDVQATCHKVGKSLAFTSALISSGDVLVATGKHTKFMMNHKWSS